MSCLGVRDCIHRPPHHLIETRKSGRYTGCIRPQRLGVERKRAIGFGGTCMRGLKGLWCRGSRAISFEALVDDDTVTMKTPSNSRG